MNERSAVTQVIGGNGNVSVNTLAKYLAALGYEISLVAVELGEILETMQAQRVSNVTPLTIRGSNANP